MWLAWFQLLVLGLGMVPFSITAVTTAVEDTKESALPPPQLDVNGQDLIAGPPGQSTEMLASVPHRDGLSKSMRLTGITHDAHGQGVKKEGEAASCFTVAELGEALSVLRTGQSKEPDVGTDTLAQFGICTEQDGLVGVSARAGLSALTSLATAKDGDVGPCGLHLNKELWVPGEETGSVSLTFEVPVAFEGSEHLSKGAPTVLLFFVDAKGKGLLEVTFNSELLLPNKQAACLSEGSQFIILTSRMFEPGPPQQQTIQIIVESKPMNNGPKLSLAEVQGLMMRGNQKRPLLFFVPKSPPCKVNPGSKSPPSTDHRTHEFLCELQKFLSDAIPVKTPASEDTPPPVPPPPPLQLSSLSSLPPLVLDSSSSEGLLAGLLSSSSPVLFSFPWQCSSLHSHRVALSLQRPLLARLREQLDDALMRFQSEEVGQGVMARLQRLRALSTLPVEQVDGSEGDVVSGESQYRALLLLKTLQTVLGVREADRAQRPARAGEQSAGKSNACRLHSLTVKLADFFLEPQIAVLNNCEGECSFPLDNGNNHAMVINHLVQGGEWAGRALCCVPTEYGELAVYQLDGTGTKISTKTNMVALACGCR